MELQEVYNKIAPHFDKTRTYIWDGVKEFTENLPPNSIILDAGCGNGKNMYRKDLLYLGFDFSCEMLKYCYRNGKQNIILHNILTLPYRNNYFDYTLSVAVIHHLKSENNKISAIKELIRVTKPGGKIFIQVWNKKKKLGKQFHQINGNHYLVEWNNTKKTKKYMRYYYLFTLGDCLRLLKKIKFIKIQSIKYEKNNWVIILDKK